MKKASNIFPFFSLLLASLICMSCSEEVITIDLNKANQKIVIEGKVIEGNGPQSVMISQSTDFYKPSIYTMVSNAVVSITDDSGGEAVLEEYAPGYYATTAIEGIPGRTYTLTVDAKGQKYTAFSTMHEKSSIDSLAFEIEEDNDEESWYIVHCYFTDREGIEEFYRFKLYINGEQYNEYYLYHDSLTDGKELHYELDITDDDVFNGDVIRVEMHSLDRNAFDYFNTLGYAVMTSGGGNFLSGTPANPTTNLSNEALGYFSAYSVYSDSLKVVRK